jgi:hypothetical protein
MKIHCRNTTEFVDLMELSEKIHDHYESLEIHSLNKVCNTVMHLYCIRDYDVATLNELEESCVFLLRVY